MPFVSKMSGRQSNAPRPAITRSFWRELPAKAKQKDWRGAARWTVTRASHPNRKHYHHAERVILWLLAARQGFRRNPALGHEAMRLLMWARRSIDRWSWQNLFPAQISDPPISPELATLLGLRWPFAVASSARGCRPITPAS